MKKELKDKILEAMKKELQDKMMQAMKKEFKDRMLEAIFTKTGGRPENPRIAEVCSEVAMEFITSYANPQEDSRLLARNCEHFQHEHCDCIGLYCLADKK